MAMRKPVKKAASKKVVSKKGDEPVRVGSKSTSKKGRVLTAAESKQWQRTEMVLIVTV
jgi:hypothetical protein